jgi:hypothetical protein
MANLTAVASVTQLAEYANRRRKRTSAAAGAAERSQDLYERITAKADAARRRDFATALENGVTIDELAKAVGLEADDVLEITGN